MRKYSCSGPTVVNTRVASLVAEQAQRADRRRRQRVHRAQQRDLRVQRLAGPRDERRRDAQQRAVGVLQDERGRRRVPRGVAARLERRADAAGRERGGVGLALDELLAGELGDRVAVAGRAVERVVLLGRHAGQRLEPVRVVRGAALQRPALHRLGDGVGERGVERLAVGERALQRLEDVLGQAGALDLGAEDVGAEDLVAGDRQVRRAERAAVGAPLRGRDVLLPDSAHGPPRCERGDCSRAARPALSRRTGRAAAIVHRGGRRDATAREPKSDPRRCQSLVANSRRRSFDSGTKTRARPASTITVDDGCIQSRRTHETDDGAEGCCPRSAAGLLIVLALPRSPGGHGRLGINSDGGVAARSASRRSASTPCG